MTATSSDAGATGTAAGDLLQLLRDGRPRTRTEIAVITGLARSTVSARVDALLAANLIEHIGEAASTGGRPSTQFAFAPRGRLVAGVDLGASHLRVALCDLEGVAVAERFERIAVADGPEPVLDLAAAGIEALLVEQGRRADELLAVGVGLPGPVDHTTGRPVRPPVMHGWDRYDVAGRLRERLGAPVLVDNDVNIMALGERARHWPGVDHLLFVKVATGIGAGVVSGGALQRGAQGTAGDIAHARIAAGGETPCICGNRGCLESVASGLSIARALAAQGLPATDARSVVELVQRGDLSAIQAVRQAGRDLGDVLGTCVSLLNPSVIVIGGSLALAGEHLIAGAREVVYSRAMPLATEHLQIERSRAGELSAIHGAAIMAVEHALAPERIEALLAG